MRDYFMKNSAIRFVSHIDGDCVNERDGKIEGNALLLPITVSAKPNSDIYINSVKADISGDGLYTATVKLLGYRNAILAENKTDSTDARINIFRLPEASVGGYRISSDDNIIFLCELTYGNYKSIFDHPYLAVYKKAHDLYGAKVHLNLFYEFDEIARSKFSSARSYFNLSMMTDKYKEEFRKNSDWLKLAFHSRSEYPPKPYEHSTADKITEDCIAVCREIVRFAGAECISDSTTVHFGEANLECARALRALGFRSLTGYFELSNEGVPRVSYYTPPELISHIWKRDFWIDTEEDITFGRIDCVLNTGKFEYVMETVADAANDAHRGGFMSIMIHEQYFYSDYKGYLADFEKRVLEPAKYLYELGYRGTHISDAVTEKHLVEHREFLG